jgi:hypothetical protein
METIFWDTECDTKYAQSDEKNSVKRNILMSQIDPQARTQYIPGWLAQK